PVLGVHCCSPPLSTRAGAGFSPKLRRRPIARPTDGRFRFAMATVIRPIGHEERLSLVDHLDELRGRLIVSAVGLAIAFGICLWQIQALPVLCIATLSVTT